jgi:hypothetical protein
MLVCVLYSMPFASQTLLLKMMMMLLMNHVYKEDVVVSSIEQWI